MDFDRFFQAEHDSLLRMCWGVTTDRELARDVAQETMCRAYERWDIVGGAGSNPAAWGRTVALNLVRSNWRRARTATLAEPVLRAGLRVATDAPVDADLVAALRSLADRQREAVVLHHLLDLSVGDCAEAMELSESSVKAHLRRGRARLSELLGMTEQEAHA